MRSCQRPGPADWGAKRCERRLGAGDILRGFFVSQLVGQLATNLAAMFQNHATPNPPTADDPRGSGDCFDFMGWLLDFPNNSVSGTGSAPASGSSSGAFGIGSSSASSTTGSAREAVQPEVVRVPQQEPAVQEVVALHLHGLDQWGVVRQQVAR
jgi:hypothetical protein